MPDIRDVTLSFPYSGLSEGVSFDGQPDMTSPDLSNVVPYDPLTGRKRGAQRVGLSKYEATQIDTAPVQELIHLAGPGFVNQIGNGSSIVSAEGLGVPHAWVMLDTNGVAIVSVDDQGATDLQQSSWDTDCNAYVTATVTANQNDVKLMKYSPAGVLIWSQTITVATTAPARRLVRGQFQLKNMIYVLWDGDGAYEGSIRRYHISDGTEVDASPFVAAVGNVAGLRNSLGDQVSWLHANTSRLCWAQWDNSDFKLSLVFINPDSGDTVSTVVLHDGTHVITDNVRFWGLASDGLGFFYVHYHKGDITGPPDGHVRKYDIDGNKQWEQTYVDISNDNYALTFLPDTDHIAISGNDVFGVAYSLVLLDVSDGAIAQQLDPFSDISATGYVAVSASDGFGGLICSSANLFQNRLRRLSTDFTTVLWTYTNNDELEPMSSCSRPVVLQTGVKQRYVRSLAVCGGTVKRFDNDVDGAVLVTNGNDVLSNRPIIFGTVFLQDVYFADGETTKYYAAVTNSIETWTPSSGSLPIDGNGLRARLIDTWQGRVCLSGLPGDPQNWFLSAINNPLDFNYGNDPQTVTDAVSGSLSDAGELGDVVNSMCAFTDDVLLFGCDSSLWQLTGNPAAGGRLDELSDITGMAWGRPWTKQPDGTLWFFGSRGGLYRMVPNSQPERVSLANIDERLATIDMKTRIVRLAWDDRLMGIWITLTSTDQLTAATHYFFDARTEAFFPVSMANLDHEPHVLHVYDGDDPDDRVVLLGCRDGYVRKFDPTATDDDGTAIDSYVMIGPLQGQEQVPLILNEVQATLAIGSSDVTWSLHVGDSAEEAKSATLSATGTLSTGRNQSFRPRVGGHSIYLKLRNATVSQTWALERIAARFRTTSVSFGRRF